MSPADFRTVLPRTVFGACPWRGLNSRHPRCKRGALPLSYKGQCWSGWHDLNVQPPGSKPGALPSCATSRWHGWQDLNLQPAVLETAALPVELHPYGAAGGNRTRVDGFADRCLTARPQPRESRRRDSNPLCQFGRLMCKPVTPQRHWKMYWYAVRVSIPRPQIKSLVLFRLS